MFALFIFQLFFFSFQHHALFIVAVLWKFLSLIFIFAVVLSSLFPRRMRMIFSFSCEKKARRFLFSLHVLNSLSTLSYHYFTVGILHWHGFFLARCSVAVPSVVIIIVIILSAQPYISMENGNWKIPNELHFSIERNLPHSMRALSFRSLARSIVANFQIVAMRSMRKLMRFIFNEMHWFSELLFFLPLHIHILMCGHMFYLGIKTDKSI